MGMLPPKPPPRYGTPTYIRCHTGCTKCGYTSQYDFTIATCPDFESLKHRLMRGPICHGYDCHGDGSNTILRGIEFLSDSKQQLQPDPWFLERYKNKEELNWTQYRESYNRYSPITESYEIDEPTYRKQVSTFKAQLGIKDTPPKEKRFSLINKIGLSVCIALFLFGVIVMGVRACTEEPKKEPVEAVDPWDDKAGWDKSEW